MSAHSHEAAVVTSENTETLAVIREEQCSPAISSSVNIDTTSKVPSEEKSPCHDCACRPVLKPLKGIEPAEVEKLLLDREIQLREEFKKRLEGEIKDLKERFDYILQNEEVRSAYMLREAYRERQEKITALQAQLECKNLTGLMFVMCAERRKSKLEKLRIIEEYTGYVRALQQILAEGQYLLLHLSRGYKTAARVNHEWREKMSKVISEFQAYVLHYSGGTPETNQYFMDLPALLKTEASLEDNPNEDPYENEEDSHEQLSEVESETNKAWFEMLDGECRPFVMIGDMAEFQPPQRRQVLGAIKAAKTVPKYWKEYVFNEMFLRADCSNADVIKDEYPTRLPSNSKWECIGVQTDRYPSATCDKETNHQISLCAMECSRQYGGDSGEQLAYSYRGRERERHRKSETSRVVINVGNRRESLINQLEEFTEEEVLDGTSKPRSDQKRRSDDDNAEAEEEENSLGSVHKDSLNVLSHHMREKDSKINYEKVCPMEQCQRMQVDSFVRCLPPYMRASPFTHFEQTYDNYETCSPEQLGILRKRIEDKKKQEKSEGLTVEEFPLNEWTSEVEGVGVQTSNESLPPCTCIGPSTTPVSSAGKIFNMADLIPVRFTIDAIRRNCFYDSDIEFDRFKVVGEDTRECDVKGEILEADFTKKRLSEIKKILKKHPSVCEIFQANT